MKDRMWKNEKWRLVREKERGKERRDDCKKQKTKIKVEVFNNAEMVEKFITQILTLKMRKWNKK